MDPEYVQDAQDMYDRGHTFFAIAYQINQWFTLRYTADDVAKALKCEDNPMGHEKFRK